MVEKKTAVIAVLCVATVLCIGLWSSSAQEAQRLEGKLGELEDDYDKLARVRTNMEENYSELKTEKEDLETEYSVLKDEYDSIKDDLFDALEEAGLLQIGERLGLANAFSLYQDNYRTLKENYDELNALLEEGEAMAESAEWVSEDERLNVTSKLITSGTYWVTYTVRVTITNVGDEPIDKVVIFLFPYEDGKFAEEYFWYESHSVENIYIGETYSHDFTYLPEEMTSYRVLAVAG